MNRTLKISNHTLQTDGQAWDYIDKRASEEGEFKKDYSRWDTVWNDSRNNDVYMRTFRNEQGQILEIGLTSTYKQEQKFREDTVKYILND